ncbi:MAG: glycoside hydrolase family 57 protein [Nitrosomonas sp.]|nr:MAG: glycoside hydrolase family 57 protein [Nitrosomonas sp.]
MKQLDLVLLWHMHQPDYRDYATHEIIMPWVYLHAIKDYTDMAYHLEMHPNVKAIVNFVPVLLDQLEDFVAQFSAGEIRCPLLRLLATPDLDRIAMQERLYLFDSCFLSNHETMLKPYPAYQRLYELYRFFRESRESELVYFSGQYLSDLLVWYHLAWIGESVRRNNGFIMKLMAQREGYSHADRLQLFHLIGELIEQLIPRYRQLAASGQIELSTTPHFHPLAPLLIDFSSARDSQADVTLPSHQCYPGGRNRVTLQLASAIASHERRFGEKPQGFWPAEGAVSVELLKIMADQQGQWAASGEGVLANSLRAMQPEVPLPDRSRYLYRPYRIGGDAGSMIGFFRDDRLSDLIGFEYAKWHGRDAAENFIQALEQIRHNAPDSENPVVSVILDGENAWESYPYNAFYFLDDLYGLLEQHAFIRTTTYRNYLAGTGSTDNVPALPVLTAGSWVYGTFSTWIGDKDKNRAWDLLCAAKHSFDLVMQSDRLTEEEKALANRQLASCESSDWFWWFGDYNPAHSVVGFDQLFRKNLINLYHMLKLPVPPTVLESISKGSEQTETSGTMQRSS